VNSFCVIFMRLESELTLIKTMKRHNNRILMVSLIEDDVVGKKKHHDVKVIDDNFLRCYP